MRESGLLVMGEIMSSMKGAVCSLALAFASPAFAQEQPGPTPTAPSVAVCKRSDTRAAFDAEFESQYVALLDYREKAEAYYNDLTERHFTSLFATEAEREAFSDQLRADPNFMSIYEKQFDWLWLMHAPYQKFQAWRGRDDNVEACPAGVRVLEIIADDANGHRKLYEKLRPVLAAEAARRGKQLD